MGCMPYGRTEPLWLGCVTVVSIPHMGCMPYGRAAGSAAARRDSSFNPSYGLHALRAWLTLG